MVLAFALLLTAICTFTLLNKDAFAPNYTLTESFGSQLNYALIRMTETIPGDSPEDGEGVYYDELQGEWLTYSEWSQHYLDSSGYLYYFRKDGETSTNMNISSSAEALDYAGYDFILIKSDDRYTGYSIGTEFPNLPIDQVSRIDYGYSSQLSQYCKSSLFIAEELAGSNFEFAILVPAVEKGGLLSVLGDCIFGIDSNVAYIEWVFMRLLLAMWIIGVVLGLFFAVLSIIKHRSIGMFNQKISRLQAKLLLEIKLAMFGVLFILPFGFILSEAYWNPLQFTVAAISSQFFFLIWLACCDFKYNGSRIFTFNVISLVVKYLKNRDAMYPFQKRMMRVVRRVFIFSYLSFAFGGFIAVLGAISWEPLILLIGILFVYIGIAVLTLGFDRYRSITLSLGDLVTQTQAIRAGEFSVKPNKITSGALAELAENINCIQDGLKTAVEKQISSERMKVELVTNVSHDLKTPLTSMTNYLGLLERETLEPAYANEYVTVLSQKTKRLTALVNDLFDVSKATSGAMELLLEPLDILSLTEQTLAELEERITAAGVTIKLNPPSEKLWVMGNGQKLYRVFENIIGNAVKYSLPGTRIYIDISHGRNMTCLTVKNIANYEMDFDPNEMLERFVRADKSRTAEGSGLGLSIAKSFTELQGGKLNLSVDGDLFKVTVALCSANPPVHNDSVDSEI